MIKNVMSLFAVASILVTVSCKKQEETIHTTYDSNNMIVAQEKIVDGVHEDIVKRTPKVFPTIEIENPNFDFGEINEGDKVTHVFKFKNTGKADLIIINAKASCGCTVPEWTKTPVKPGESGEVKIVFNSAGKVGHQRKTITLTTNTESGNEKMNFVASVKEDPNSAAKKLKNQIKK